MIDLNEFEVVSSYLGIPYLHHGRTKKGLDCWGLIKMVYAEAGIKLLDIVEYDKDWASKGANYFVENYHSQWEKVEQPRLFDVVLFNNRKGVACHAGLMLREGNMFHASEKSGVVICKARAKNSERILDGFYRLRETND